MNELYSSIKYAIRFTGDDIKVDEEREHHISNNKKI